ncbi:hypothetical protein [Roseibium sp.]|uniref:hypothetical protein n=1 Tax=Roseibium sp. TaxID=1936156 RepID=UPI003BA8842D
MSPKRIQMWRDRRWHSEALDMPINNLTGVHKTQKSSLAVLEMAFLKPNEAM